MLRTSIIPIVPVPRSAAEGVYDGTACVICNTASGEMEIFDKLVVENSVMTGGHYCNGKEATSLVSEVMTIIMFEQLKAELGQY